MDHLDTWVFRLLPYIVLGIGLAGISLDQYLTWRLRDGQGRGTIDTRARSRRATLLLAQASLIVLFGAVLYEIKSLRESREMIGQAIISARGDATTGLLDELREIALDVTAAAEDSTRGLRPTRVVDTYRIFPSQEAKATTLVTLERTDREVAPVLYFEFGRTSVSHADSLLRQTKLKVVNRSTGTQITTEGGTEGRLSTEIKALLERKIGLARVEFTESAFPSSLDTIDVELSYELRAWSTEHPVTTFYASPKDFGVGSIPSYTAVLEFSGPLHRVRFASVAHGDSLGIVPSLGPPSGFELTASEGSNAPYRYALRSTGVFVSPVILLYEQSDISPQKKQETFEHYLLTMTSHAPGHRN